MMSCFVTHASNVELTVSAPQIVGMNQQFRLVFNVKNASAEELQIPDLSAFDILAGPSTSTGKSVSIINGSMTTTTNSAITYILSPKKVGTFTISSARLPHEGKTLVSNAVTIKVVEANQNNASSQGGQSGAQQATNSNISDQDIFIRTEYTKKKVYEQEQIIATIKLYHRGNVSGLNEVNLPEYKGFVAQDIELNDNNRYGDETYNNSRYKTFILKQTVLFPQRAGTLEIEQGSVSVTAQVQNNRRRRGGFFDMDDFFNTYNVNKVVKIPSAKIEVMSLPTEGKPQNFNGAVGSFKMESSINTETLKANEAVTIKLKISGNGNLKFAKIPEFTFPNDFEVYDPKVDTKIKASSSGVSGSKSVEYLAIPRYEGEFTIPAATFSYFDPQKKRYQTLSTGEYVLNVQKGEGGSGSNQVISNYSNKENIKYLGKDIRFINSNNIDLSPKDDFLYGSTTYWMFFICPALLLLVLYIVYRKQAAENANIANVRNKRANKMAKKRLKIAEQHLIATNKSAFYEELLKALSGYISDKLTIPVAELNKDNIEAKLKSSCVSDETTKELLDILDTCEFARYAPVESGNSMETLYEKTIDIISQLEEQVKK